jgi:hypothetical protein
VGSSEHGNEPLGSIKNGDLLDQLSVLLASQEGLCSIELDSYGFSLEIKNLTNNSELESCNNQDVPLKCFLYERTFRYAQ